MPIVTCPDCGNKVSDSAVACPSCGYPYENNKKMYLLARKRMDEAKTSSEMIGVAEIFGSIKGFQDSDALMQICRDKAKELPATNYSAQAIDISPKAESKHSSLYAILLTVFGAVIVFSSFADGYFQYSFASSSLSGGTRYYDSNFLTLIGNISIADLIMLALLATIVLGVLSAWITAKRDKHLELNCVIATSVTLVIVLICSIWGPISFTDHNNLGFGFYSYKDFEGFGIMFYMQVASGIASLVVSIISKVRLQSETR